jgi:hypothetical protein
VLTYVGVPYVRVRIQAQSLHRELQWQQQQQQQQCTRAAATAAWSYAWLQSYLAVPCALPYHPLPFNGMAIKPWLGTLEAAMDELQR